MKPKNAMYTVFFFSLIILVLLSISSIGSAEYDPSPIVIGIDSICALGVPGPLNVTNAGPIPVVTADSDANPSHAMMAVTATSNAGRVVALGHDGFFINDALELHDNKLFGNNIINWLEGTQGKKKILVTTGHGEPLVGTSAYDSFFSDITSKGYTVTKLSGTITPLHLSDVSILFISCPGPTLTDDEVNTIKNFVSNGGGLFIQGLGWAWVQYENRPLEESPMNKICASYGFKWENGYVSDLNHNFNGNPIFNIVYPDTRLYQLEGYLKIINAEGWNQTAVDASTSILGTTGITALQWEDFFTNFFESNSFTNNLWGYIGYPAFYWISDEAKINLQNGMSGALLTNIEQLTEDNQANLGAALNTDPMLLQSLINSHKFIHRISKEGQISDSLRLEIYNYYKEYVNRFPGYLKSDVTFDEVNYRYLGILRGQVYMNLKDLMPLNFPIKADIAQTINLNGRYLDIWNDFSVMILDNKGLDQDQLNFIYNYLNSIPKSLHDLGCISQYESLGNRWDDKDIGFEGNYINIGRYKIGSVVGNPFPEDISAKNSDLFVSILAHELNHVVDGFSISKNTERMARLNALIDAAGVIRKEYLRSSRGPSPQYEDLCQCEGYGCNKAISCEASVRDNCDLCFPIFTSARGEFFASLANELFVDTAHTFDLAKSRFDEGYKEPMNQFLFFAEIYSEGGDSTKFYVIDTDGTIHISEIPLTRDSRGRIDSLIVGDNQYKLVLDDEGNVISMSSSLFNPVALQAANGQYLCAEGSGGGSVVANRDWINGWETFKLIDLGNGNIALQASNGQYLCAEGGGGGAVVANRNAIAAWETFKLIDLGNGYYALKAYNGQYVCAEGGGGDGVVANRNAIAAWETFRILDMRRPAKVALRAYNGQYVCAEGGGGDGVTANRNAASGWETFKLIDKGNGNVALQAYNGQYLCAEGGGGQQVVANRNAIAAWETFSLIYGGNGNVALQAFRGQYVCAEGGGGDGVVANRDWIAGWETFKLIPA